MGALRPRHILLAFTLGQAACSGGSGDLALDCRYAQSACEAGFRCVEAGADRYTCEALAASTGVGGGGSPSGGGAFGGSGGSNAGSGGSGGSPCTDVMSDPKNCGGCGVECNEGWFCDSGACRACFPTLAVCDNSCVDLKSDPDNCGVCGKTCADGCSFGACTCPGGILCGAAGCVDPGSNPNCGGCGITCQSPEVCLSDLGECRAP